MSMFIKKKSYQIFFHRTIKTVMESKAIDPVYYVIGL